MPGPQVAAARPIRRLLVANRSEIAIRVFRAATELDIATVAIYAEEDKLSLHRFKADEAYRVGAGKGPLEAYLSIDEVIRVAKDAQVDAIHPGYGFLSESPEFAEACATAGIVFIGPSPETMRTLGNKVAARNLAISIGVPVMPATPPLPDDPADHQTPRRRDRLSRDAESVLGRRRPRHAPDHSRGAASRRRSSPPSARRNPRSARTKSISRKLVQRARHVEVQILGDRHGTLVHLFERDCSIQRRNQKVIERAPAPFLDELTRQGLCDSALMIGRATRYVGAGTVEFLMDVDTGEFYFIEVNPRIQVEHTVTEVVTGLDIVKAQIRIAEGGRDRQARGDRHSGAGRVSASTATPCNAASRPRTPSNNFIPDYGRITAYRGAMGFGIRVDGGTAYSGAVVTRFYDPLLEKVTAWAPTPEEAIQPHGPRACANTASAASQPTSLPRGRPVASEVSAPATTRPASSTRRPSCSIIRSAATARPSC